MALNLSKNENVIRSWTYASSSERTNTLTVTDKRIVATREGANSISRIEVPLSAVKSVSSSYSATREEGDSPQVGLIMIGAILGIAGVFIMALIEAREVGLPIGIGLLLLGVIMVAVGATRKQAVTTSAGFKLHISTYGKEGAAFRIGEEIKGEGYIQEVTVSDVALDEDVIMEIIDTIGALVINKEEPAEDCQQTIYDMDKSV
ncbi:MAG: hypothetical protein K2N47_01210 [Clostridia bacterium]|nr:hypothetical protein [Clostridia bacterium]